jgi:tetratricopeptide (TPR) repeat protein
VVRWLARRRDPRLTWNFVSLAHAVMPALPVEAGEIGLAAAKRLDDARTLGEAHAQLGAVLLLDPLRLDEAGGHLTVAVELLEQGKGELAQLAMFGLASLLARQGRPAEARSMLERALVLLDPGREPLACSVALFAHAEMLMRSGSVDRGQQCFAQALILSEATGGGRFNQGWLFPSQQLGDEFLVYLNESVDAPRVSAQDRRLAGTLLELSLALRPTAPVARGAVHTRRGKRRQIAERYGALS